MNQKLTKNIARRDLLKLTGIGAAALVLEKAAERTASAASAISGNRYAMVIDLRRCYGCHACSVSCKAEYDVPLGSFKSWVKVVEKGKYPYVSRHFLPRLCNQCSDPPCVTVCPTHASHIRGDGIVAIDENKCIGCKSCMAMCPYDSRYSHPVKKIAQKCDFCKHRVSKGIEPSCVNTCPARARIFGDLNNPNSEISKLLSTTAAHSLKPELGTEPKVFYIGGDNQVMRSLGGGEKHE
jgi:tetrathionate reductase subunit B